MGGWGPFTVREIANVFEDHGLEETREVESEQGVRRSTAAGYIDAVDWDDDVQRNRLLEVADEVLVYYPEEEGENQTYVGPRLRRALRRVRDPAAAATPPEVDTAVERTRNLDDPWDVWAPGRIRLFFSHTHTHRELVGDVARQLETWPFSCFVAHDAIEPSLAWQQVIESALATCQAFVAFMTDEFRSSAWCDQELGWALGRGIVVIPVHLTTHPHGFAGTIQDVPAALSDPPRTIAASIAEALAVGAFRETRPGAFQLIEPLADAIVDQFCRSNSFDLTRRRFAFLRRIPRPLWTPERCLRLDAACQENAQIREANLDGGQSVPEAVRGLWPSP